MLKKVPHTYVIVFLLIIFSAVATWFIPGGEYVVQTQPDGTECMIFQQVQSQPQTWQVMTAFFDGFQRGAGIIVFILIIGGAFWVINSTKAIDAGIDLFLLKVMKLNRFRFFNSLGVHNIIITLIMVLFSVFGAVFGMSEETIAFIVIIVPLAISMGYDSITGVCMVFVAAGLGFAGAVLNPFTIGIAQELSGIPMFSGIEYRLLCWVVITSVGIAYTLRYASKVKNNPHYSVVYEEDDFWRNNKQEGCSSIGSKPSIRAWVVTGIVSAVLTIYAFYFPYSTLQIGNVELNHIPLVPIISIAFVLTSIFALRKSVHLFILNLLGFTILVLVVGVMGYQWYIGEIAGLFLALGLSAGFSAGFSANQVTRLLIEGAKDILSAAMVVGLAAGIIIILENGHVIHSILHFMAEGMSEMGRVASIGIMYLIQTGINIVIPSGSAKAALTMPIMAPFSDLIQVSRQATVMAFQFGDGFTNMITPTSGVLIGVLGMARIPYAKWVRFITPLMIILVLLGFLLLIPTVTMTLNGF